MKLPLVYTFLCLSLVPHNSSFSQGNGAVELRDTALDQKRLNFFVISKRKKGSLDLASRFNVFRTKAKSLFRKKRFVSIVADDLTQASAKIQYRLRKYNARIGTLWFDSHGMYKKGYSLFFVGRNEVSFKTLGDTNIATPLRQLSCYTDLQTKVIIGSCYGGATYHRPSIDYGDTTRMDGDSLMIALGDILAHGTVYASESWVMTKPGLFLRRPAVAGFPGRKLFLDICYLPAWENVGKWNGYEVSTGNFTSVNPITLDMSGNAIVRSLPYASKKSIQKDISKNISKLQPGLYK